MKPVLRIAAALVLVVVLGVAASPRKPYLDAVKENTKELLIYSEFETALILRGTYLSETFRRAMGAERARLLGADPQDAAAWLKRSLEDDAAYHEIVFSADSGLAAGQQFGTTDDGWVVRLAADGIDQPLVTIYRVRKPNPLERALYPHINLWADFWIARFEKKTQDPAELVMQVGSGYGHGQIRWSVR